MLHIKVTYKDMFDPSSKHIVISIGIVLFLLASFLYFLHFSSSRRSNDGGNSILPIIALVLAITTIRLLPDVADSYYRQNFYDADGHMVRDTFVAPNRKGFSGI
jgi:hypothetical protein